MENVFNGIQTVDAEYYIGKDTLCDNLFCYVLVRRINGVVEILLDKQYRINNNVDKEKFEYDIEKLAEIFNAEIIA